MLPELETLLVIQDRDRKILALKKDLENLPRQIEHAKARLQGDEAAVQRCREELQHLEVETKKLELDIQTREDTIRKLKQQQFETRKNEEYRALGHEVERYQEEVTRLEDAELELMEKAETVQTKLAEARASLSRTQEVVKEELSGLEERRRRAEEEIESLEASKSEYTGSVEDSLYSIYQRLLKSKGGTAIVPLSGGQCKGCHMKVTSATVVRAKAEKEVTHCEHCGRMVYYEG